MQTKNPFFDDLAQLMTNAAGAAQGVTEEMQTMMRAQGERFIAEMDLVGREEFDAIKAMAATAREEADALKAQVVALEARLAALEGRDGAA